MFKCDFCDKSLSSAERLRYHITNKVCQKPNKICPTCKKVFKSKQYCQLHIANNVCGKRKLNPITKSKYENMSKEELIEILSHNENNMESPEKTQNITHNTNNINININNNIIVFPHKFGTENMEYINQKLGDIIYPLIKGPTHKYIPCLFEQIHNNKRLPEYHNIYVPSERSGYVKISDGETFRFESKKNIIEKIIDDKRSIINEYIEKNGDKITERALQKYDKYQDQLDENSTTRKELELDIVCALLNMKSVVDNDEKTRRLLETVVDNDFGPQVK